MSNKEKYRKLCKDELSIPIFSKDWWLDAVAGDDWDVALAEQGGKVVASFPYVKKSKFGLQLLTMPKLTQTLGPWINYPQGQKYNKKLSYEKKVLNELINQLPSYSYFSQSFNYHITNWLPFYWENFEQSTRYTYVIENISNHKAVFSGFSKNLRSNIKKAEKKLDIATNFSLEDFYDLNKMTFERQGLKIPYSLSYINKIDDACAKHNSRKMFFAIYDNKIITAIYVIWDKNSAYLLMSGSDPQYRNLNGKDLLVWHAIKYLSNETSNFDFEGSMIENIESYNRSFGAVQKPYFNIYKENSRLLKVRNGLREVFK